MVHCSHGDIPSTKMEEILFQTRYSRVDTKLKKTRALVGRSCNKCGSIVLNLYSHISIQHCLSSEDDEYLNIVENSKVYTKQLHYRHSQTLNHNPLFNIQSQKGVRLYPELIPKSIAPSSVIYPPNVMNENNFDSNSDDDVVLDTNDNFSKNFVTTQFSRSLIEQFSSFKEF